MTHMSAPPATVGEVNAQFGGPDFQVSLSIIDVRGFSGGDSRFDVGKPGSECAWDEKQVMWVNPKRLAEVGLSSA